ncbi:hypothetical protein EMCRGX_G015856 [Ephydatia muelleri]|eukprot:Em0005g73a
MNSERLVWVDLEMGGLDTNVHTILEMACAITDSELNVVAETPDIVIHQSDDVLSAMTPWCVEHHGKSGLTAACQNSNISLAEAEEIMVTFVKSHVPKGECPLAGNSIYSDKRFLEKYMPSFMAHLHYRMVDVSTVKELCRRWHPDAYSAAPRKEAKHRAIDDIRESIAELRYYRNSIFKTEKS